MPLKDLSLKITYNSDYDSISSTFFNPVLRESKKYMRVSAYFSSKYLAPMSEGLSSLAWNGGKARIIASILTSEEDIAEYKASKSKAQEKITKIFPDVGTLKELMEDNNVEAFGKLVQSGSLEMKFALSSKGIFHMKYGIAEDAMGDRVAFAGSLNETSNGYSGNVEQFDVFRSWVVGEKDYEDHYFNEFESYWSGESRGETIIVDMPPETTLRVEDAYKQFINMKHPQLGHQLREYQYEAVEFFEHAGFSAMLEMATGTGKTITALECVNRLFSKKGKAFTIIAAPTLAIAEQWKSAWESFFHKNALLFEPKTANKAQAYEYASLIGCDGAIIATYNSLSTSFFLESVLGAIKCTRLFIADEAHWLGARRALEIANIEFEGRIGLSATPQRLFDEEGTSAILSFFKNNEYKYALKRAIKEGYLSRYSYFPYYAELLDEEIEEYGKLTHAAARKYAASRGKSKDPDDARKTSDLMYIQRAKISKRAKNKFPILEKILLDLKESGKLENLIIFFDDSSQLAETYAMLSKLGVSYGKISSSAKGGERKKMFLEFANGNIKCMLAMKIMDEGIDIPSAQREIIMASSSNPRQYIQRAGRILRNREGKGIAEIYDIITYANPAKCPAWLKAAEKESIKKEMKRAKYLCDASENKSYCIVSIHEFAQKFNIPIWE